jgi:hypothetical protein
MDLLRKAEDAILEITHYRGNLTLFHLFGSAFDESPSPT